VVQGTASLIFKKALLEVGEFNDVTILLPMHDALLFEYRLPNTPVEVVKTFEGVMTEQLHSRVKGKASIAPFILN
jgi:DNA polymerase-1